MIRLLAVIALVGAALAAWLFPRAFPIVTLADRVTMDAALHRADSFARAHALPLGERASARFSRDDSLMTFVDFVGGGRDTLDALVRGNDAAPFRWSVRRFTPRDVHETRVHMSPSGRVIGFERRLAESDQRPARDSATSRRLADSVLTHWLAESRERWHLAASSYETRKASNRVDRTFTYERTGRRIADAPIRLDIVIAGDVPSLARPYVDVPESFMRRYGEMRASNELLSNMALAGMLAIALAGALGLRRFVRDRHVRWKPALVVGGITAALVIGAGANALGAAWYDYDTATSPAAFQATLVIGGLTGAALLGVIVAVTLAVAESAARIAFPRQLDWWAQWRHRGTREVAVSVAGGYALAATGIAYVAAFYLMTRTLFGWWVPTEILDDPNQIATPMPWLAGLAASFQAAVWEEALFRALPLSLLSLWVGNRPRRSWWMAGGVVLSALVFGFAHSDYPSWPAYSRGFEIFLEAALWAVLFLRMGLLVTVVAHFLFNMTLFGLFAAGGDTTAYTVSAVIVGLLLLSPALSVAWAAARRGGLAPAPDDARGGAWSPPAPVEVVAPPAAPVARGPISGRARQVALAVAAAGAIAAFVAPRAPVLGPRFTTSRAAAMRIADSLLGARGIAPAAWTRLATSASDTMLAWPRFLKAERRETLADSLTATYAVPAWWIVRYVRPHGPVSERAEEWRVRVFPDGRPLDVRHLVPDSAPGARPSQAEARRLARAAMARAGIDTALHKEISVDETPRPARLDVQVTYQDTSVALPANAAARTWVSLAGVEPLVVRRGIELPEQFVRDDRLRQFSRLAITGGAGLALVAVLIACTIVVIRKRRPVVDDAPFSGRQRLLLLGGLAAAMIVSAANDLPSTLAGYDTAKPWSSFLTSTTITLVAGAVFGALLLGGLWLLLDAARRRAGIALIAGATTSRWSDDVIAGLGIAGTSALASTIISAARLFDPPRVAAPPAPPAEAAVPALGGLIDPLISLIGVLPVIAVPLLVIVAISPKLHWRALLAGTLLALVGVAVANASDGGMSAAGIGVRLVMFAATLAALRAWGVVSAVAWIVAALADGAVEAARGVLRAAGTGDVAGVTQQLATLAVAVGLVLLLERIVRARQRAPVPD